MEKNILPKMKIGIGQINTRIGDFSANAKKIEEACLSLAKDGAEFAVFPNAAFPDTR